MELDHFTHIYHYITFLVGYIPVLLYVSIGPIIGVLILWCLVDFVGIGKPKRIPGLPQVPGLPIVGNLHQLSHNPSLVYSKWAKIHGDVYQTRMGSRKVVVANSYDSIMELWMQNWHNNNSRPTLFTFHNVVSKTQGLTIGTTPYCDSYKRKRKFVATNLNKTAVGKYSDLISLESIHTLERIDKFLSDKENAPHRDINLLKFVQAYHLKIALFITYGYAIDYNTEYGLSLLDEVTSVENKITRLRSHTSNPQDYIPILKFLAPKLNTPNEFRRRRDKYIRFFGDQLKTRLEHGEDVECFVSQAWKIMDEDPKRLSPEELQSACLTLVSAGLDNAPLNFFYCIGMLSNSEFGYEIQNIAVFELLKEYGSLENAWEMCVYENLKVDYICALIKETLRHMTVLPLSLPRETTSPIKYRGCTIPKGTILFMNAAAANNDPKYYPHPEKFEPKRWLSDDLTLDPKAKLCQFSFGIGSRMCAGSHLAYKELYVLLVRTIIKYKIREPHNLNLRMKTNPFELNECPDSIAIEPENFLVKLLPR